MTISSCVPSSLLALGFAGIYYQKDQNNNNNNNNNNEKKRKEKESLQFC
jgi:hypothetical protein